MPTRCKRWFLLQILLLAQHVSGTIMPIIRSSRVLYRWLLHVVFSALVFKLSVRCGAEGYVSGLRAAAPHHTDNLKTKAPNTTGSNHLYNTLELLMMGIMVSETCWASNKICNKNHLLHLVSILFSHVTCLMTSVVEVNTCCTNEISNFSALCKTEKAYFQPSMLACYKSKIKETILGALLLIISITIIGDVQQV